MTDTTARLTAALADRYTIDRELGAGGMATVYLAEDLKHDRKVAIKVLRPELAAVLGAERFLQEIKVTANLQHPHILPLFDSGEADSFLYYVMPYVKGESLRALLDRKKQLPIDRALEITKVVASALGHAHRQGVVHRDIKPENILLADDGQPLVADFGIALAVNAAGGTRLTETGMSLGTPEYMSPEQATGDRQLEPASDIYSLGAVLYEMLVGDPPHMGNTAQAIIARIMIEKPTGIRTVRDTVPQHVEQAVMKALAKVPADRWQNADELLPHLSLTAPPADGSTPPDARSLTDLRPSRRHAISAKRVVIGTVTVASVALLLWLTQRNNSAGVSDAAPGAGTVHGPSIAGLPLTDLSPEGGNRYLGDGIAYALMDGLSDAGLSVASAFAFRERAQDVRHIGADLGVAYVLDGSVIMSGTRMRVSVRLVNTSDGFSVWNENFEDEFGDVLALQDRVVESVVDQLRDEFGLSKGAAEQAGTTENPDAYDAYLQGRFHLERRGADGIEGALKYFTLALTLDPLYALAWSGLADAQTLTIPYGVEGIVRDDILEDAIASAKRAIEIAPDLAQAHASLGHTYQYLSRGEEAEQESLKAIELDPRYPPVREWYALLLLERGRGDEALAQIDTAFQLAPLEVIISHWYAWIPEDLDRLDLSEPRFASLKEKFPRWEGAYPWWGHFRRGDFDRAAEEFRQWRELSDTDGAADLAMEPYWPGLLDPSTRQASLRRIVDDESVDSLLRAFAAAHEGDQRVFELVNPRTARGIRPIGARHAWVRNDPRYVAHLRRLGLEQ
jgi:serine/threonine protein kinase/tetratricopeptide (TPR) repeat protein